MRVVEVDWPFEACAWVWEAEGKQIQREKESESRRLESTMQACMHADDSRLRAHEAEHCMRTSWL